MAQERRRPMEKDRNRVMSDLDQYVNEFLTPDDVRSNPERARVVIEMQADRIMILKAENVMLKEQLSMIEIAVKEWKEKNV